MPEPEVKSLINGYQMFWPSCGITIKVNRVQAHSDGRIIGFIYIVDKDKRLFPESQFNFVAPTTRDRLVKQLSENLPNRADWKTIIYQMCQQVQDINREGEPVRELWTHNDTSELEFLLEPLLIKGVPTIIFGEKGVCKSTMALVIYLALMRPWHDNPLGWNIRETPSISTLYLDWELPGEIAQRNLKHLVNGMELGTVPLYHRRCRAPLADDLEQIANQINSHKAEVIIIDSLARACGDDLMKTEPANRFFEALDKLNITSLIIGQTAKDTLTKKKSIYGNALFTYYARSIFEICAAESSAGDCMDVAMFHRWSNLTKRYPDKAYRFMFNGASTTIERTPVDVAEFIGKVNLQNAILESLRRGSKTADEIAQDTGAKLSSVKTTLSGKLAKRNLVVKLTDDKWGLLKR